MEKLTKAEQATLARLQAKQKRIERDRKAFFSEVVKSAEQVTDYLLEKRPDVVTSVLQSYGYEVVKKGEEMSRHSDAVFVGSDSIVVPENVETSASDFEASDDEKSHENVETSASDFGVDFGGEEDEEPFHFY